MIILEDPGSILTFWSGHYQYSAGYFDQNPTHPAITCSKLTIETLEQDVKLFKVNNKRHQNEAIGVILVSLLLTLNIFHTLF